MILRVHHLEVKTRGRGTYEITDRVESLVAQSGLTTGLVTVFLCHTSASLILFENADRSARVDLERYFERLVPEREPYFTHTTEGPDDMPAHLKSVLTRSSESIPVDAGRMCLGTWQGLFVFEHRSAPHLRQLAVMIMGD